MWEVCGTLINDYSGIKIHFIFLIVYNFQLKFYFWTSGMTGIFESDFGSIVLKILARLFNTQIRDFSYFVSSKIQFHSIIMNNRKTNFYLYTRIIIVDQIWSCSVNLRFELRPIIIEIYFQWLLKIIFWGNFWFRIFFLKICQTKINWITIYYYNYLFRRLQNE